MRAGLPNWPPQAGFLPWPQFSPSPLAASPGIALLGWEEGKKVEEFSGGGGECSACLVWIKSPLALRCKIPQGRGLWKHPQEAPSVGGVGEEPSKLLQKLCAAGVGPMPCGGWNPFPEQWGSGGRGPLGESGKGWHEALPLSFSCQLLVGGGRLSRIREVPLLAAMAGGRGGGEQLSVRGSELVGEKGCLATPPPFSHRGEEFLSHVVSGAAAASP